MEGKKGGAVAAKMVCEEDPWTANESKEGRRWSIESNRILPPPALLPPQQPETDVIGPLYVGCA